MTESEAKACFEFLQRAIQIVGGQVEAAKAIGIRQQSVSEIIVAQRPAPSKWCLKLEAKTLEMGEPIYTWQLRPDLYPKQRLSPPPMEEARPA